LTKTVRREKALDFGGGQNGKSSGYVSDLEFTLASG
jgi:hypothetical protein